MNNVKKLTAAFAFVAFIVFGIAATTPPPDEHPHKNLKILPKNIMKTLIK